MSERRPSPWDSEDHYPPLAERVTRAWSSGWKWFLGISIYMLCLLPWMKDDNGERLVLGPLGVIWCIFLVCVPYRMATAALKPMARRLPGAMLLAFLVGVPLATSVILVFLHYDPTPRYVSVPEMV